MVVLIILGYTNPDGSELSMVFQFEHMCLDSGADKRDPNPLPLTALKRCYDRWQTGLSGAGWNSLFLENHDLPRIVSRWGMTESTGWNPPKCWPSCATGCRALLISTRGRRSA